MAVTAVARWFDLRSDNAR
jgi:hypothetical protein